MSSSFKLTIAHDLQLNGLSNGSLNVLVYNLLNRERRIALG